ncbi:MAG: Planctomycete cytochrome, partial [Armatimonadetes bacterium]|nr:Planctomycete cytochrome [Armatimonadota bacterium]
DGWSMKRMLREMALSSTYRQSSDSSRYDTAAPQPAAPKAAPSRLPKLASRIDPPKPPKPNNPKLTDPSNRLLWRMNRRRLSIEQWRDGVLAVSGQLDATAGPSLELTDPANRKRTVYARVSRLKLNDLMMQFDYPDANVHAEKRSITTTPMQKLFLLNSPFMQAEARDMAARLNAEAIDGDATRVRRAYQTLYGREPAAEELSLALAYLQQPATTGMSRWERYAQVLLVANEMLYID